MTNEEILQITRSWVGHVATDQDVRKEMNRILKLPTGANAAMARLINKTVDPATRIKAKDVPKIVAVTKLMYRGKRKPTSPSSNFSILNEGGGDWPIEDI
jgi:hypothetical protein